MSISKAVFFRKPISTAGRCRGGKEASLGGRAPAAIGSTVGGWLVGVLGALLLCAQAVGQPAPRIDYALAYFPPLGGLVMHGGWGPTDWKPKNETWLLTGSGWKQLTVSGAPALVHHSMAYDAAHQVLVTCGMAPMGQSDSTIYTFDGSRWTAVTNLPIAGDAEMTYDSARQRMVLFWASSPWSGTKRETWESDGATWVRMTPAQPPVAVWDGGLLAFHETLHQAVLVGSANFSDPIQTWLWDGTNWRQATGPQPANALAGGMAYDRARDRLILLATDMKTWAFDGTGWAALSPAHAPPYSDMAYFTLAYDPQRQRAAFFCGEASGNQGSSYPVSTWEWDGADWGEFSAGQPAEVKLSVQRLPGAGVRLSWPANAAGFVLQTADALSPDQWRAATAAQVNDNFVLTNNATQAREFFRLMKSP